MADASVSTGNWWDPIINIGAQVLGPALGAAIGNKGADDQADAITGANREAIGLQRDIYLDQTARSEPWRQSGLSALNFLNQWNGLPQVQDGTTSFGSAQLDSMGRPITSNLGAGQPVAGHTGGGGSNPFAQVAGGIAGNIFGGPIGGSIGNALGGLVRDGGDNWQTVATQAPSGYDYEAYMQSPGLKEEWAKPDIQALFGGNRDAYAYWHANGGTLDGKQGWAPNMEYLNEVTSKNPQFAGNKTNMPVGGAQVAGQSGNALPDLWDTIKKNPIYTSAVDGFAGQGGVTDQLDAAYSANGQVRSGAAIAAKKLAETRNASTAINNIYGNYAGMAGVGANTAQSQNANAGQFAQTAGNLTAANGQAAGAAAATKNANWLTAGQNGVSGVYDYAKGKGWI